MPDHSNGTGQADESPDIAHSFVCRRKGNKSKNRPEARSHKACARPHSNSIFHGAAPNQHHSTTFPVEKPNGECERIGRFEFSRQPTAFADCGSLCENAPKLRVKFGIDSGRNHNHEAWLNPAVPVRLYILRLPQASPQQVRPARSRQGLPAENLGWL